MDKRAERCVICHDNAPKGSCPHLACGACCLHKDAHKLTPAGKRKQPQAVRKAAERAAAKLAFEEWKRAQEELQRAQEELQRARAAALASAHNKATSGASIVGVSESPLLALPSEIIDRIFLALLVEPECAASLACEHSTLFAAFGRTFHIVDTLSDLEGGEVQPGAQVVVLKATPLVAVADSLITALCVLLHATIDADMQRSHDLTYVLEDISLGIMRTQWLSSRSWR